MISKNVVSAYNSPESAGASPNLKGFLIDLDLAKQLDALPNAARASVENPRRTGTLMFMAIEILQGSAPHIWRHDLESFLYVLIYLCVAAPGCNPSSRTALIESWSVRDAANNKLAQMNQDSAFRTLITWFAPSMMELQLLVERFRNILFPPLDGARGVQVGALPDRDGVYEAIVDLFNEFIRALESKQG